MSPKLIRELKRALQDTDDTETTTDKPRRSRLFSKFRLLLAGLLVVLCTVIVMAVLYGVDDVEDEEVGPSSDGIATTEPTDEPCATLGPQFRLDSLPVHEIVDQSVFRFMGGWWYTLLLRIDADAAIPRDELRERIIRELTGKGWKATDLPKVYAPQTLKLWGKGPDDLSFEHDSFEGCPQHWQFQQTIHVSDDARTVALYREVAW